LSSKKEIAHKLKRGLILAGIYIAIAFLVLCLLRDNLTIGATIAAPAVILVYFGAFFLSIFILRQNLDTKRIPYLD